MSARAWCALGAVGLPLLFVLYVVFDEWFKTWRVRHPNAAGIIGLLGLALAGAEIAYGIAILVGAKP